MVPGAFPGRRIRLNASPRTSRELNPCRPASRPASATRTGFRSTPAGPAFITRGRCRGKPSHDESQTAPSVGHANSVAATWPAEAGGTRRWQRVDTTTELLFLTTARQLAMHPDTAASA